jgi:hypothetical protein
MDKEQARELLMAMNQANQGNWLPFTLLASLFGIIVVLILVLGKRILKDNVREHVDMRSLLKVAQENQTALKAIVISNRETNIRQEIEIKHLKETL